jgi:hypothetical protein
VSKSAATAGTADGGNTGKRCGRNNSSSADDLRGSHDSEDAVESKSAATAGTADGGNTGKRCGRNNSSSADDLRGSHDSEDAVESKSAATAGTADVGDYAKRCGSKGTPLQHRERIQAAVMTVRTLRRARVPPKQAQPMAATQRSNAAGNLSAAQTIPAAVTTVRTPNRARVPLQPAQLMAATQRSDARVRVLHCSIASELRRQSTTVRTPR